MQRSGSGTTPPTPPGESAGQASQRFRPHTCRQSCGTGIRSAPGCQPGTLPHAGPSRRHPTRPVRCLIPPQSGSWIGTAPAPRMAGAGGVSLLTSYGPARPGQLPVPTRRVSVPGLRSAVTRQTAAGPWGPPAQARAPPTGGRRLALARARGPRGPPGRPGALTQRGPMGRAGRNQRALGLRSQTPAESRARCPPLRGESPTRGRGCLGGRPEGSRPTRARAPESRQLRRRRLRVGLVSA